MGFSRSGSKSPFNGVVPFKDQMNLDILDLEGKDYIGSEKNLIFGTTTK
jgi:hypothetical protein